MHGTHAPWSSQIAIGDYNSIQLHSDRHSKSMGESRHQALHWLRPHASIGSVWLIEIGIRGSQSQRRLSMGRAGLVTRWCSYLVPHAQGAAAVHPQMAKTARRSLRRPCAQRLGRSRSPWHWRSRCWCAQRRATRAVTFCLLSRGHPPCSSGCGKWASALQAPCRAGGHQAVRQQPQEWRHMGLQAAHHMP